MSLANQEWSGTLSSWLNSPARRYGFAFAAVVLVTLLRFVLGIWTVAIPPLLMFFPAVVVIALAAGFGPGLTATILSAVLGKYLFMSSSASLWPGHSSDWTRILLFSLAGVLVSEIGGRHRGRDRRLEEYEKVVEGLDEMIFVVDRKYRYTLANRSFLHRRGMKQELVLGRTPHEVLHPGVFEKEIKARLDECFQGKMVHYEMRYEYPSLGQRCVAIRYLPIRGAHGVDRVASVMEDISERKQSEERLREFERVVESLEEGVIVLDRDYRYVLANRSFLLGKKLRKDQVIGHLVSEHINPELFESEVRPQLDKCLEGKAVRFEKVLKREGGEKTLDISYFPIPGTNGIDRVGCILQDISERKIAERSLRMFRALVDQSNDAVEVVDPQTLQFLDVNETACRQLGYTREELLSMTVFDINPMVQEDSRAMVIQKLRESGSLVLEGVHRRRDGSTFPVEIGLRLVEIDRDYVVGVSRDISERKFAEDALRESESRYRDLVDHSEDLVCTHDLEGNLLSVNPAPARILGYTVEELLKIPMRDLIIPEGRPAFDEYLERLKTTGQPESGLLCVLARSGEMRTWEFRNTLRTSGVPEPIVRGMAHDITEKRRAELALIESEKRYRMLFEKSVAGVAIITMDGSIIECNQAWARVFGHTDAEQCRGGNVSDCYSDPSQRTRLLQILKREGSYFDQELEMRRKDGSPLCLLLNSTLVTGNDGEPLIQTTVVDISARKQAEAALRASEQRLRLAQEVARIGTFDRDLRTGENRVTPEMELIYGLPPGTYPATIEKFIQLVHPDDRQRMRDLVRISTETGMAEGEWRVPWSDGSTHWVAGRWQILKDSNGVPVRAIGMDYDVTALKQAEEALQQSEERFRVALKDSPITVFNQDRDRRYTWVYNTAFHSAETFLGKTPEEVIGEEFAASLRKVEKRVLATGVGERTDVWFLHEEKKRHFEVTLEPLRDASGAIIGLTGASMNVARLRELADTLQLAQEKLAREKSYLQTEIQTELGFTEVIGQSPALREALRKTRLVAPTDSTVLLLGETGTGKELVARSVHGHSTRRDKTFIKLNCAAVPTGLLESELFGHEKGAFTGAVSQKIGRIELADKGTLFLDEIGELPLELQPKLLRVLQDREFERLGGIHTLKVDVRIIAATNRDLQQDVEQKQFRQDLFYRLNVFPIELPPLRERRSDIPMLVRHFIDKHSRRMRKPVPCIPETTMETLTRWNWPGNIRELENMIERMVILSKDGLLAPPPSELESPQEVDSDNLSGIEREHIVRILRETNGVLSGVDGAANRLGIKRTTLQSMLKRFGIDPQEFRRGTGTYDG